MAYNPKKQDFSNIEIPKELYGLRHDIAVAVHDAWAAERKEQGWTWGLTRNDAEKKHPCLVPFDDLPPEEQKYDWTTAETTIGMILANGYKIVKE